jgi:hypothetical protein
MISEISRGLTSLSRGEIKIEGHLNCLVASDQRRDCHDASGLSYLGPEDESVLAASAAMGAGDTERAAEPPV